MLSKTQESTATLANLRPLGLIETTRKIWTNLVLNKVKRAVYKYKILQQTQNGFTPNKGTDSELLQLLSALESALSHEQGIDLMTWDIRKAFDSVGQNLQYLSWRRIGVPRHIAAWLVLLDVGGSFTVRSPYALNQLLRSPTAQLATPAEGSQLLRELGFTAQQGLTQGDVKSTLGWNAVFDILLTAFKFLQETGELEPVLIQHTGSQLFPIMEQAYADDLVTLSASRSNSIRMGLFVSTALMVLGLQLATSKLRLISSLNDTEPLQILTWHGGLSLVPFEGPDVTVKILGLHLNLNLDWEVTFQLLMDRLQKLLLTLSTKQGRLSTKLLIMVISLQTAALYVTQFASFSKVQLSLLDRSFIKLIRGYAHTANHVATEILQQPALGGYFVPLIERTYNQKRGLMQRAIAEGGATRKAMEAMLLRHGPTESWEGCTAGKPITLTDSVNPNWWASTLIHWGQDLLAPLQLHFPAIPHLQEVPVISYSPSPEERRLFSDLTILSLEELVDWAAPVPRPVSFLKRLSIRHFAPSTGPKITHSVRKSIQGRQLKTGPYPPSRHLSLRLSYEDGTSELITLLGWSKPQEWHVIRWQLHKNIVTPVEEYYPLGTGSNLRHLHSHIAYYATARIFLQRQWIHAENQIVLVGENPSYRIRPPLVNDPLYTATDTLLPTEPPWCAEVRSKLSRAGVVPTYLVCDASAKQVAAVCSSVFCTDTSNHTVQAGVVIAGSSFCPGRHPPACFVRVTGIPRAARSYDGELIGATCLLTLRRFWTHLLARFNPLLTANP
jgi:hypothetical protein